jgi:hypothetical protein
LTAASSLVRLDLSGAQIEKARVKTILFLVAMIFCMARVDASFLRVEGDLTWNVTEPQCGFKLNGELQNLSSVGTGPIKLVLWATAAPYPSAGQVVGEFPLGSLPGNAHFTDFTIYTKANVPFNNGTFYFTIAVVEYTTEGWKNVVLVPTGTKALLNGNFVDQKQWVIPRAPVVAPPTSIKSGTRILLTERATGGDLNMFPAGWREKIDLTVKSQSKMIYFNEPGKTTLPYDYSVAKAKLNGKSVKAGKIFMHTPEDDDVTFKNTVHLFFQGPNYGTYKSTVTGYLWRGTIGSAVTWGTFKFQ